uniref:Uncharacterized protein n=1 Tax=candidate division WOR-3 bacterium TaxID=2052148 RepID=A0A7V3RIF5_UNCW3
MNFAERIAKIPRQIIYTIIALAIIIPLIIPIGMPINVMPQTQKLFNAIESLPPDGKPILISCDFDPQSMPELYPMLEALLNHCFNRNLRVLILALWPQGAGMAEMVLKKVPVVYNKNYGKDYVFLGYKAGAAAVVLGMGDNFKNVFPADYYNNPLDALPLTAQIKNYNDISLVISLSAGDPGYRTWLLYGQSKFGFKLGAGVTAVSAADTYPYLNSGQLTGVFAGMKGAAEYETALYKKGYKLTSRTATKAMDAQSLGHFFIMLFIIIGNVGYFFMRRKK